MTACAADATLRAELLKVAIPWWLRQHQKEGLYREEKITARISGRRRKRQKTRIPYVEGGQQDGYPSHAPLPQLAESQKSTELPSLTTWPGLGVTRSFRQQPVKCPRSARQRPAKESSNQRGAGRENAISSYTLQLMSISRNLFYKSGVQKPSSTLLQCQSLPTSSLRAVRSEYPADIVVMFIYRQGGGYS